MRTISVKITDHLYEQITHTAKEHEVKLSDIIRECLQTGLNNFRGQKDQKDYASNTDMIDIKIQKQLAVYTMFTHFLLERLVKSTVSDGNLIYDSAEEKTSKRIIELFKNPQQSEN